MPCIIIEYKAQHKTAYCVRYSMNISNGLLCDIIFVEAQVAKSRQKSDRRGRIIRRPTVIVERIEMLLGETEGVTLCLK